jgi:hypothetical protein
MVFLNDLVTLKATLIESNENKLRFTVNAVNQNGADVLKGEVLYHQY